MIKSTILFVGSNSHTFLSSISFLSLQPFFVVLSSYFLSFSMLFFVVVVVVFFFSYRLCFDSLQLANAYDVCFHFRRFFFLSLSFVVLLFGIFGNRCVYES